MRSNKRAFSLPEILVVMAILLPLLLAIYAAIEFLYKSNSKQEAQLEPVSQMRRFRTRVFPSVYGAGYIYTSLSPPVVDAGGVVNGRTFTFPAEDGTAGDILMLAAPEDFTSPNDINDDPTELPYPGGLDPNGNPDGFPDGLYTMLAIYTEPVDSVKRSRLNPDAERLVVAEWDSVAPTSVGAPLTIDFTALGPADRQRVFNVHGVDGEFDVSLEFDQIEDPLVPGTYIDGNFITGVTIEQRCLYGNSELTDSSADAGTVYDNNFDFTLQVRNAIGVTKSAGP
jgi:prepilin-type N-terminal cleavage/methylation domain-containing protein